MARSRNSHPDQLQYFCYPRNYHPDQLLFFCYRGLCSSRSTISIVFHLLKMNPSDSLGTDSNISRTNTPANFANPSDSLGLILTFLAQILLQILRTLPTLSGLILTLLAQILRVRLKGKMF